MAGQKSSECGKYFGKAYSTAVLQQGKSIPDNLTPFQKRRIIYHLGGGNITSILSKLINQRDAVKCLERILFFYPISPLNAKLDQRDIVTYIVAHISLNCLSPQNQKVALLRDLRELCRQFPSDKRKCLPSALFLLTLLFWQEDDDAEHEKETKYKTVQSAVEHLENSYRTKMKDIPQWKRRIYTQFFLGNGNGLDRFVHKKKFEGITKDSSLDEKYWTWLSDEVLKTPESATMLK